MKISFVFAGIVLMFGSGVIAGFPPKFSFPQYYLAINKNAEISQFVGQVYAYTNHGEPVTYSVSEDMTVFDVDKYTGEITVAKSLPSDVNSYAFEVVASTNEGLKDTTQVLIFIY